jgi:3-oxoadipate CoA-transferase, alpha subunit
MAAAARCAIVEAEEVVPAGSFDPDQVHTPGLFVQRIVPIPPPPEGIVFATAPTQNRPPA